MNYFLLLIILGLCGGGYFEYTLLQQKGVADQQQITDLSAKLDQLQTENKKLEDDEAQLTKSAADAKNQIADLTAQAQTAQSALADAKKQAATPPATPPPPAPAPPAAPNNNLGTITTLDGKTYQNCQLLKVEADGITFSYSEGITKVFFGLLPLNLQAKFGYDPHQAAALTAAQLQYQEDQRKAAAQAGGN
jgi:uncharacterized phage infection (PIP) family protein YhgE